MAQLAAANSRIGPLARSSLRATTAQPIATINPTMGMIEARKLFMVEDYTRVTVICQQN